MDFLGWMALCGALLLFMALSSAYLRRLPISTSAIYLILGVVLSPLGYGLLYINLLEASDWFERLAEVAVIISLFVGGLKLRLPLRDPAWRAAYRLAGPVMLFSIIGVAAFAHLAFGLDLGVAILLGAVLAPTDPVLAGAVSVSDAADRDRMRYGLSGEAGFNDGMAFPFVVFGLLWMQNDGFGDWVGGWALHRLVWAVPAGLLLGYFLGKGIGHLAIWLRSHYKETAAPNDFLALALIALSYVGAETIGAWGFLATFAAGLGLRRAEIKTASETSLSEKNDAERKISEKVQEATHGDSPAEDIIEVSSSEEILEQPTVAAGLVVSEIISFGDTMERLLEVLLVVMVGVCLGIHWDWRGIPLALVFFILIRPLFTQLFLIKTPTGKMQRALMSWFGIRGIGSLYYLSYALNHGLSKQAAEAVNLTITVVAVSILLHGITAQPVLDRYKRQISKTRGSG